MKRSFESLMVEILPYDYDIPEEERKILMVNDDKNRYKKILKGIPKLGLIFSGDIESNLIGGPVIIGNAEGSMFSIFLFV